PIRRKKGEKPQKSKSDTVSWEGVDQGLFEALRGLRRQLAEERQVPPYVIFSDATLRELARVRPSTLPGMRLIYGIGDAKLRDYGDRFLRLLVDYCGQNGLAMDNPVPPRPLEESPAVKADARPAPRSHRAF